MELYNVYWREKAGTYSAEVRSSVSVSLLYLWLCYYEGFLTFLNLHTMYNRRLKLDALFFISVYSGWKCSLSLLNRIGIRDFSRNITLFLFAATFRISPSARCVSAANHVCKEVAIFKKIITFLKTNTAVLIFLYRFSCHIVFGLFLSAFTVFVFYLSLC